jgi:hypothetical protein
MELTLGESQSLKGVEVHEVEATTPIHECFGEPGRPDQWVDDKEKPPWLGDSIQVVCPVESDWRFRLAQVLQD